MRVRLMSLGLACLAGFGLPQRAQGACYEIFGCTDSEYYEAAALRAASCQVLYEMRNGIYKERGYCFKSAKAIAAFGNAGCQHDDVNEVPLNIYEQANIVTIKQVEQEKGCE